MASISEKAEARRGEVVHPTSGYSHREELANAITHGLGTVFAVAAVVVAVFLAALRKDPWMVVACSIYGASLIALYVSSTVYHSVRSLRVKRVFLILDHSCIYLLIAGTYTPFLLGPLRGGWGWSMFGVVWGLAIVGVMREVVAGKRGGWLSSVIYLAMGWMVILVLEKLYQGLSASGFWMLIGGGVIYSMGVVFYLMKRLPYGHAIWHLFVMAGSLCHYFSVLTLVW